MDENAESFDLLAGQLRYAQTRGQNFLQDLVTRFERAIYTVSRQQVVHGIAVGTAETLAPATWTDALVTDLAQHVAETGAATHTLRHLLEG